MTNVAVVKHEDCLGCSACYAVCPVKAIEMKENEKGFLVSFVDEVKCCNCGRCNAVCPAIHAFEPVQSCKAVYAAIHKDKKVRMKSTSGGVFTAIAAPFTDENAAVYGSVSRMNDVYHVRSTDGDIAEFRGSKYVQSDLRNCFQQIKQDLRSLHPVLFVGTPCQCDGLQRYLDAERVNTEQLVVVDFICHGTPSRRIYRDFIGYCSRKKKKQIVSHVFRSKAAGWHNHLEENCFADGSVDSESFESQLHRGIFQSGLALKNSCYTCRYTHTKRCSDITIGDFWGIQEVDPSIDDNRGISFVMINTQKGESLFERITPDLQYRKMKITDTQNPHLHYPPERPLGTDAFWQYYFEHGFYKMCSKYFAAGKLRRGLSKVYHSLFKR